MSVPKKRTTAAKAKTPAVKRLTAKPDPEAEAIAQQELVNALNGKAKAYTVAEMVEALEYAHGMKTVAARHLHCSAVTVQTYIDTNPDVRAAYDMERERSLDNAELQLMKAINNGEMSAIIFYLKTQGKKRGYVERIEHMFLTPELIKRFEEVAQRSGKPAGELFGDMVNAIAAEIEESGSTSA